MTVDHALKTDPLKAPFHLYSNESSFQFFFELSPLPMMIFDRASLSLRFVNEAAVLKYGYSKNEFLKMTLDQLCLPEEAESFLRNLKEEMKASGPTETRCHYKKKDGTFFLAKGVRFPVLLDGVESGLITAFDIARQESALSALRDTEEKFQAFMAHNPSTAWIKDENFRYIYCNPNLEQLLRARPGSLTGQNDFDLFPAETARMLRENDIAVLNSGKPMETVEAVPGIDGKMRQWSVIKFLIPGPQGTRLIAGEAYDFTEQKAAEEKIRFQASILDQVRSAVIVIDNGKSIIYWNHFAEVLYQWTSEEALGKNLVDLIDPEPFSPRENPALPRLDTQGQWEGEFTVKKKNGKRFPVFFTNAALHNESGEVIGFIGISSDMSDHKAAQKALEEKNIALKEILGQLELEKREIRDKLASNIDKFVFPALKKMRKKVLSEDHSGLKGYLNTLERSLHEVADPLSAQLASKLKRLTQKELEICNLLRGGLTSKEIATMLEISPATVETHRVRIRRKLKIQDRTVNLISYLQSP